MEDHTTIAMDLSKSVFEIAVSKLPGRVCERKRLSRAPVVRFFANQPAAAVFLVSVAAREARPPHAVVRPQSITPVELPP